MKDIHNLILQTHEPLLYVAEHFGDAISNMDADEVTECLDKIREVREYTDRAIEMNNKQFEKWNNK